MKSEPSGVDPRGSSWFDADVPLPDGAPFSRVGPRLFPLLTAASVSQRVAGDPSRLCSRPLDSYCSFTFPSELDSRPAMPRSRNSSRVTAVSVVCCYTENRQRLDVGPCGQGRPHGAAPASPAHAPPERARLVLRARPGEQAGVWGRK